MYLLDTTIVSFSFRVDPLLQLYEDELRSGAPLFISVQTVAEILFGMAIKKWGDEKRARMSTTLAKYAALPIDYQTAEIFSEIMAASQAKGRGLDVDDCWIAATAKQNGLTLLAHDRDMKVAGELGVKVICHT